MAYFVVGEYKFKHYEFDFVDALIANGQKVYQFNIWENVFCFKYLLKIEYYFSLIGPATLILYCKLFFFIFTKKEKCDIKLFFWRPTLISPLILRFFKFLFSNDLTIISYNNDNPFSNRYNNSGNLHQRFLWNNFIKTIPIFDISIVYRPSDIIKYKNNGAKKIILFPPGFSDKLIKNQENEFECKYDIVFIGHYEKKRLDYLNSILNNGHNLKIFGTGWENKDHLLLKYNYLPIVPVYGDLYFKTLSESKICLCFLSELNDDVYTRRNFEIPACKSVMLSERTIELNDFFIENEEAYYFSNEKELNEKIQLLLSDYTILRSTRNKGFLRSVNSGYSINSQVKKLLKELNEK